MSKLPAPNKERFVFIDGLRAIAALGVMFYHLHLSELQAPLDSIFPAPLRWLVRQGLSCVQIFFVISGFVIAWSLRNMNVNLSGALNFILRRQIRLDPAYWFAVLFASARLAVQAMDHPADWPLVPHAGTIVVNLLYLQNILHRPEIMSVSWTLCLEVQLYLVYILVLFLVQRVIVRLSVPARGQSAVYLAPMIPLLLASLWLHNRDWAASYFIFGWYLFGMGALVCWTVRGLVPAPALMATLLVESAWAIVQKDGHVLIGPVIAASIYAGYLTGGLTRWLGNGVLQYFGRISYSLYLMHRDTARIVMRLGMRLTGLAAWPAVVWYVLSAAASVGVAQLMYMLIERPSMNLAARLKQRSPQPIPTVPLPVPAPAATAS
jgi:peptidoglycan/LPS O-acetylase OafA/YrhL